MENLSEDNNTRAETSEGSDKEQLNTEIKHELEEEVPID
jgi:hypothetical protein